MLSFWRMTISLIWYFAFLFSAYSPQQPREINIKRIISVRVFKTLKVKFLFIISINSFIIKRQYRGINAERYRKILFIILFCYKEKKLLKKTNNLFKSYLYFLLSSCSVSSCPFFWSSCPNFAGCTVSILNCFNLECYSVHFVSRSIS